MTNETILASLAGIILSLLSSYIPKWNTWYAALGSDYKRLIMLGLLLASALVVYGASCAKFSMPFLPVVACTQDGLKELLSLFIAAAITNYATYGFTPQTPEVKKVLVNRESKLPEVQTV